MLSPSPPRPALSLQSPLKALALAYHPHTHPSAGKEARRTCVLDAGNSCISVCRRGEDENLSFRARANAPAHSRQTHLAAQRLNCSDDGSSGDKSLGSCCPSLSLPVDNEPAAIQLMTAERESGRGRGRETRTNFYVCVLLPLYRSPLFSDGANNYRGEDETLLAVYRRRRRR